jgi:hypothetical protein
MNFEFESAASVNEDKIRTLCLQKSTIQALLMYQSFLTRKTAKATKQKAEKRGKPKPEEQEGMPQHQHCPPAKHHGNRNPNYHEDQQKDQ